MFPVRAISNDDITVIAHWFQFKRWPLPPLERVMPQDGFVATDIDGSLIACCWLYSTGSAKAEISWINVCPDVEAEKAKGALRALIEKVQKIVGYASPPIRLLVCYSDDDYVISLLSEVGFKVRHGYTRLTWIAKEEPEAPKD